MGNKSKPPKDDSDKARLDKIRDRENGKSRVQLMGLSRSQPINRDIPFADCELTWLDDQDREQLYPFMDPSEYWPLITGLAIEVRRLKAVVEDLKKKK